MRDRYYNYLYKLNLKPCLHLKEFSYEFVERPKDKMEDQDESKVMVIMKVYAIKSIILSGRSSQSILSSLVMCCCGE